MRVVDAEDPDAAVHPVVHHSQHFGEQSVWIVVKSERVDVLILLWWVLCVGDRAVCAVDEPLGVRGDPGVVGCALHCEVKCDLEAELAGAADERPEVLKGAEVGVHRVVAALDRANRPRTPRIVGTRVQSVVGALAVDAADRVNRGQIDDVEAHGRDRWKSLDGGGERARSRRVKGCPL